MSQFTVYKNTGNNSKTYPYFIDIQNELLDDLNSRLVIPLTTLDKLNNLPLEILCPAFTFNGDTYIAMTHQMTSIPSRLLTQPITELTVHRDQLIKAIDFLITG